MRIVIDLQGLQEGNFNCPVIQSQIVFLKALIKNIKSNEVDLILNGNLVQSMNIIKFELGELVKPDNFHFWYPISSAEKLGVNHTLNMQVSELIKVALINSLQPDVLLLTKLTKNSCNDILIATSNLNRHILTVALYEITDTRNLNKLLVTDNSINSKNLFDTLNNSNVIICLSKAAEKACYSVLNNSSNKLLIVADNVLNYDQATDLALISFIQLLNQNQHLNVDEKILPSSFKKKRLAYVSTNPPDRTNIADYSALLVPELSKFYDVDVIGVQPEVMPATVDKTCVFANLDWFYANYDQYDQVIYHFGNSTHGHSYMFDLLQAIPGIVIFHDFYLSGVLSDIDLVHQKPTVWAEALYYSYGYEALQHSFKAVNKEEIISKWPSNLSVLQNARAVIVHSEFAKNLIHTWYPKVNLNTVFHIPLLRPSFINSPDSKKLSRAKLGLTNQDFIVCCFGIVAQSKFHHRLLDAWLNSTLAQDKNCTLIFVGNYHSTDYEEALNEVLATKTFNNKFKVTGWVSQASYYDYLNAANIGVQLSTLSSDDTLTAILDCINFGLATITNAKFRMNTIDESAVYKLPNNFENTELTKALEELFINDVVRNELASRAQNLAHSLYRPEKYVTEYVAVIEKTKSHQFDNVNELASRIMALPTSNINHTDLQLTALSIDKTLIKKLQSPQIFVDVSELCIRDSKTGIQRVVKAVLKTWLLNPPEGFRVEPVYANNLESGYKYARSFTLSLLGLPKLALQDDLISYQSGDHFLGLDLGFLTIQSQKTYLKELQNSGVDVKFVVYDLLPILQPHHFLDFLEKEFTNWLNLVCEFDGAICISRAVADDLQNWLIKLNHKAQKKLKIDWFHLGADIDKTFKSKGTSENMHHLLQKLNNQINFLMVGTIESRKGHQQVLDAYEILRNEGCNINLIFVGKPGWKVEKLIQQININPQLNQSLFWLEGVSDEYLEKLYACSTCLIAASYGEGFGLPLIEAAQHQLPIIARDIPVFREVVAEYGYYFSGLTAEGLAQTIKDWIELYKQNQHPKSTQMPWLTWTESVQQLGHLLLK